MAIGFILVVHTLIRPVIGFYCEGSGNGK